MVFTIVTVIFLPMSFIASVFAIPLTDFDDGQGAPTVRFIYVAKFIFGVGLAISIPLIAVAFAVDSISTTLTALRRLLFRGKHRTVEEKTLEYSPSDTTSDLSSSLRRKAISELPPDSDRQHGQARHRRLAGWVDSGHGKHFRNGDLEKGDLKSGRP